MKNLFLDLYPTNIPFLLQCTKAAWDKVDPTVDNLIIYEEGGADTTFDSGAIAGSPFDPDKVNAKTGLWGKLIPKSALTAGKFYIALWEMTVDNIATSKVERYFACNAASFKATGFSIFDPGSQAVVLATEQPLYAPAKAGDVMEAIADLPSSDDIWSYDAQPGRTLSEGATGFVLPVMQGQAFTATVLQDRKVTIVKENTPIIPFQWSGDYSTWAAQFGVKKNLKSDIHEIEPADCSTLIYDAGTGTTSCFVTLTASQTNIEAGRYFAEVKITKDGQVHTALKFILIVIDNVL